MEMIHTSYKNHTDHHKKDTQSPGDPPTKRQKQSVLSFTVRSGGVSVVSFVEVSQQVGLVEDVPEVGMEEVIR